MRAKVQEKGTQPGRAPAPTETAFARVWRQGLFGASRYVASVDKIEPAWLVEQGVKLVLLDRDNTVVPRSTRCLEPSAARWVAELRAAGIEVFIISNNFHSKQIDVTASELGCGAIDHAMKPAPFALRAAMRRMGISADQTVMVGDQVFTDVASGNLAGVRTILVRPQSLRDLWYTQIFRLFEPVFLHGHRFEGE